MMNMKKKLWSLAHMVLLGVGTLLTCTGVFLVSMKTEHKYNWRFIPAYIMIVVGLLAVLIGVFWTMFHSMKSKIYRRGGQEQHIRVYTIDRLSSFPPSYEESEGSQVRPHPAPEFVVMVDGVEVVMSLAPPLYSQDSSEAPDCTWSWEQPPRYSQVERIQQVEVDADERREILSAQ